MQSLMALSDSSCLFISNSLETHVVRTWCSSRAGLALCALSTPGCIVNFFFLLSFQFICTIFESFKPFCLTFNNSSNNSLGMIQDCDWNWLYFFKAHIRWKLFLLHNVQRYSQHNIYWDEVALVFLCFNYSQETLSNALSDYTKYNMGRNCLVL